MEKKEARAFQEKLDDVIAAVEEFGNASSQLRIATDKLNEFHKLQKNEQKDVETITKNSEKALTAAKMVLNGSFYEGLKDALDQISESANELKKYSEKMQQEYEQQKDAFNYENLLKDNAEIKEAIYAVDDAVREQEEFKNILDLIDARLANLEKRAESIEKAIVEQI